METKPNIFNIATSELSQDAFFTWLLQWADETNKVYNEALSCHAQSFIKHLISKQHDYDKEITNVKAGRQWENIDVWAEVNNEILIIIEDKTFTTEHSNQLEKYRQTAKVWCHENNFKLVCIYLKTGSDAYADSEKIEEKGFAVIYRQELIDLFSGNESSGSEIFNDFYDRLKHLESSNNSYETLIIGDWHWDSWKGFYQFLESKINVSAWRYVSNPSGGFLGLWWHFGDWKGYSVYLQIEQGNLCFKIGEVYDNHSEVRNEWHKIIMEYAELKKYDEIEKPPRFGTGTYMTVAIVDKKYWLGEDNLTLDKERVIKNLRKYETVLNECIVVLS